MAFILSEPYSVHGNVVHNGPQYGLDYGVRVRTQDFHVANNIALMPRCPAIDIGYWLINKARRQAAEIGTQAAARNLRKQGVPLDLALAALTGRVS